MIFLTVGSQMPFDRLVRAMDEWARNEPGQVIAQIGKTTYRPRHLTCERFVAPSTFRELVFRAEAVVAHAGMGSIITALELGRPILVMPRHGALGETRNDHQLATARRFETEGLLAVAHDARELARELRTLRQRTPPAAIGAHASLDLLTAVRGFLAPAIDTVPAVAGAFAPAPIPLRTPLRPLRRGNDARAAA